ncbi:hypothetical protein L596_026719 [Steinernema carpocapsae]|uniref:7TM GPCR serpentine receptor class x (Srx) domain-containing protein n=1 Tax=Steinernema carpocapsae TaxID=34508 RepID=A0A4U5M260_STECR|nr:hypothetical protein L596_026719 [Steinernema carpocapsae]
MAGTFQLFVGIVYMILPPVLVPIYVRIVYIFIKHKKYRSLECYQIMIQVGQIAVGPGIALYGLIQIIGYDPDGVATVFLRILSSTVRMEAVMSLVLALNRLRIICGLRYPQVIHTIILVIVWVLGVMNYCFLFTPWYGYLVIPGEFLTKYDTSKPYTVILQTIGGYTMTVSQSLTLIVYLVIIVYLIRMHCKVTGKNHSFKEKSILYYAFTRFLVDMAVTIIFNYGHLPHIPSIDFPVFMGYILNNLGLPPMLYLILYRNLRREFCGRPPLTQALTAISKYPNPQHSSIRP